MRGSNCYVPKAPPSSPQTIPTHFQASGAHRHPLTHHPEGRASCQAVLVAPAPPPFPVPQAHADWDLAHCSIPTAAAPALPAPCRTIAAPGVFFSSGVYKHFQPSALSVNLFAKCYLPPLLG